MRADLHVHTYFSDGLLSPEEVVKTAKLNGVELLAVTDHDTAEGYKKVKACAEKAGVRTVSGIEVSAYSGEVKLHTLGYNVDTECAGFKRFVKDLLDGSVKRAEEIIYKLNKNGVCLKIEDAVNERFSLKTPLHAMHISRAGAKKGYANTPFDFYKKYLMHGAVAFSCAARPAPEETLEVISACGGFCSLAHPGRVELDKYDLINLIKKLKESGLCGIEGVYSAHTKEETAYYKELAEEFGLLVTGGSDTHYNGGNRKIGAPYFEPSENLLAELGIC